MARFHLHPQTLLHRRWRSMHPFRPRISRRRRIAWMAAFLLLSSLIGAYAYVADSDRLRNMAQAYLSSVLSGTVRIGHARLSIFQGLSLENVRVFTANPTHPDALIFSARSVRLNYALGALLRGRVQATQIIATQPLIRLVQNMGTHQWNYQRLFLGSHRRSTTRAAAAPPALPEIILRDGRVENAEVIGGRYLPSGTVWFEGRLGPAETDGRYPFTIQSHAAGAQPGGPQVTGWFYPGDHRAHLALTNFQFGQGMRAMLPEQVRQWSVNHHLAGRLDIQSLSVEPSGKAAGPKFDLRMRIRGVTLNISPDEWRTHEQNMTVERIQGVMDSLAQLGVSRDSVIGKLTRFSDSPPLHLRIRSGQLHFSDAGGIQIQNLLGSIEGSPFCIRGTISDYSPESAFNLQLFSPEGSTMHMPTDPQYVRSLPLPIQEFYDRFKPSGSCRLNVNIARPSAGEQVSVAGEIDVINGNFTFDHFPYPLRRVQGQMLLSVNRKTGNNELEISDLSGRGIDHGPNADCLVHLSGKAGPFNHDCVAHLIISGQKVTLTPKLIAALPPQTQQALNLFAPDGQYPSAHGDFVCTVDRTPSTDDDWHVVTQLDLDRCAGRLDAFPYPIRDLAMKLTVYDDHLDIQSAQMRRASASMSLSGNVSWTTPNDDSADVSMSPHLTISAQNVPINNELLQALPPDRVKWVESAGLAGLVDVHGRIDGKSNRRIALDLDLHLHDGQLLKSASGSHAVQSVTADAHLDNDVLDISHFSASRDDAKLAGSAKISWASKTPTVQLSASAQNLLLDSSLRQLLPANARKSWDQLDPSGTIDAEATFQSPHSLRLTVRPRQLDIRPAAFPWSLDQLSGSALYDDGKFQLNDLKARHGTAIVMLSGTGENSNWELHLSGRDFPINSDFLHIAPKPLADLISNMNLAGKFDFDFSKLLLRGNTIDFALKLSTRSASLSAGLAMTKVNGICDLAGSFHGGQASDLTGNFDFDSLDIAGRQATDLTFKLDKPAGRNIIALYDLSGSIAGGSLAGQMSFDTAQANKDHYTVNLVLRDADIAALAPDTEHDIHGQLSASMDLEGRWSDPSTRMGRGDVLVTGKQLYKIPILLGVSQIANLSLPLNQPFTQGTAQYAVQGQTVVFDSIELKAANMQMTGSGQMDFRSKKFDLLFTTNNPNWPKLPVINDLLSAAEHQLLQIHVSGTIEEPKVSAGLFSAVPTTIDRVIGK